MRFNNRVMFVKSGSHEYDFNTGEYAEGVIAEKLIPCYVVDLGLEKSVKIFGDYRKDRKVIFLQNGYSEDFDYLVLSGLKYKALQDKHNGKVFYLEHDDTTS